MYEYEERFVFSMCYPTIANDETGKVNKRAVEELAEVIDHMSNNMSIKHKEIADTLIRDTMGRTSMLQLALTWIDFWAEKPLPSYYERNTEALKRCKELKGTKEFAELCETYSIGAGNRTPFTSALFMMVSEYLNAMHRTLMQTFTRTLFTFLDECSCDEVQRMVANVAGKDKYWCDLPFV